jgi:predicted GNAT superfamily acetyltransferase
MPEYVAAQRIARAVWGFEDRQLPSTFDLQVAGHVGGLTAGAFDGATMVGFVHGFPQTNLKEPSHHSHLLAVRPAWRGRGLSVRLKLFQRAWCLDHGIRLVTWTYDPFRVTNARLNLNRLRARARRYLPDLYGPLGGLYEGLPSDRFEVFWRLDALEVERAARGRAPEPPNAAGLPIASARQVPRAARLALALPLEAGSTGSGAASAARRSRLRLRRLATALFDRGYEAVSLSLTGERALYVFERSRRTDSPRGAKAHMRAITGAM